MNLQLIQGEFSASDTLTLLSQMIQVKIQYHENQISPNSSEEDIKARETKIKRLQHELALLKQEISTGKKSFSIDGNITIT